MDICRQQFSGCRLVARLRGARLSIFPPAKSTYQFGQQYQLRVISIAGKP